jgi:hypothetical protein
MSLQVDAVIQVAAHLNVLFMQMKYCISPKAALLVHMNYTCTFTSCCLL